MDEPPAVAVARTVDERESRIRALIADELDVEIDPQSLFDVPLSNEDAIAVETTRLRAVVIRADELSRLSVCSDEGCDGLVLDLSRNRSRRYCSTTCANRNAVAAYRARGRGLG